MRKTIVVSSRWRGGRGAWANRRNLASDHPDKTFRYPRAVLKSEPPPAPSTYRCHTMSSTWNLYIGSFVSPLRKFVTDQVILDMYRSVKRLAAQGGPYATLANCSQVEDLKLSAETIRSLALGVPAVPAGRPRVVVVNRIVMYGHVRVD